MRALGFVSIFAVAAALLLVAAPTQPTAAVSTRAHLRVRAALGAELHRVAGAVRTLARDADVDAEEDAEEDAFDADADADSDADADVSDADAFEADGEAESDAEVTARLALERLNAATDRLRLLQMRGPKPRRSGGGGGGGSRPQAQPTATPTPEPPHPKPQPPKPQPQQPQEPAGPTLRDRVEHARDVLEGLAQKAVDNPMMRGVKAKLEEVLHDPRTQKLIEGGTFAKQVKDDVIDPAREGYKAWQEAKKLKDAGGAAAATVEKAAEKGAGEVAKDAGGVMGKFKVVKDFMDKNGDKIGAFTEAAKFGVALVTGDREEMMKQSAKAAGGAMKALKIPGADFVSAGGELVNAADKFAHGDAAGGSQAAGRGAEDVLKAGLNKAGPVGVAVATAITVTEGAMGVANKLAPGLNARTNVGEVMGEAAYAASQKGVGQFGRELAAGLANDQRANSDNVVVKAAGVASQTLGKAMQTVDMGAQIVGAVADKAACQAQAAVPCMICAPWDGDCRAHMFDCRTKC